MNLATSPAQTRLLYPIICGPFSAGSGSALRSRLSELTGGWGRSVPDLERFQGPGVPDAEPRSGAPRSTLDLSVLWHRPPQRSGNCHPGSPTTTSRPSWKLKENS